MTDQKRYGFIPALIGVAIGISISIGIESRNPLIPVITCLVGIDCFLVFRRRVKEPIHDERTFPIHAKASSATFAIFVLGSFLVGSVLLMMDRMGYTGYYQIGSTIFVMANIFLILHFVFRSYYHRKYGG